MKILLLIGTLLNLFVSGGLEFYGDIQAPSYSIPDIIYTVPKGLTVTGTPESNGFLGVVDQYGNGVDVYIETDSFEYIVKEIKLKYKARIKNEVPLDDNSLMFRIDPVDIIYPAYTIVVSRKANFTVVAYMLTEGDLQARGEFERKTFELLESLAEGGSDVSQQKSFLVGFFDVPCFLDGFGES